MAVDVFDTVTSLEDLYALNDKLSSKRMVAELKEKLKYEIDETVRKTVYKVLNRIATKEVWRKFSHKGQRGAQNSFVALYRINRVVMSFIETHVKVPQGEKVTHLVDRAIQIYLSEIKRPKSPKKRTPRKKKKATNQGNVGNEIPFSSILLSGAIEFKVRLG